MDDTPAAAKRPTEADDGDPKADTDRPRTDQSLSADSKFRGYVAYYGNLEGAIWKNMSFVVALTAFAASAIAFLESKPEIAIRPLTHDGTTALALLTISVFYFLLVGTHHKMRRNQARLEKEIDTIEGNGFFSGRVKVRRKGWKKFLATSYAAIATITSLGLVSLAGCVYFALRAGNTDAVESARPVAGMTSFLTFDAQSENLLGVVGVSFDIGGAFLLARALALVTSRSMLGQASSGYGGISGQLIKMFAEQKVDACFGLGLLVIGFMIQGAAGYGWKTTNVTLFVAAMAVLALVVGLYYAFRDRLAEHEFKKACRTLRHPSDASRPAWTEQEIDDLWAGQRTS